MREWTNWDRHTLLAGKQDSAGAVESHLLGPWNVERRTTRPGHSKPWYTPKGNEDLRPHTPT